MGTRLLKMSKLGAQPGQQVLAAAGSNGGSFLLSLALLLLALCQDASAVRSSLLGPLSTRAAAAAARGPPGAARDAPCATHTHNPRRSLGSRAASHPMGSSLGNFVRPARGSGGGSINNPSSLRGARASAHLHPNATWSGSGRASFRHTGT